MRLAVSIVGIFLIASPTKFGSEAIVMDNWRERAPLVQASLSDGQIEHLSVAVEPVSPAAMVEEFADLEAEGPPEPPADAPIEWVCNTLAISAQVHGLPTGFFARLIWQESKFKQRAVSPAGAQGVAQFMPAVAAERGLRNPFDPIAALPHSARFLKEHVEYFGNLGLAAAAYNAGARRVMDWLARRGKLPEETRNYVKYITGHPPEAWTETNEIELAVDLPKRAPCEGVADLSRTAETAKVAVQLEAPVAKVVEDARIAAAKAEAEAKARQLAAAKAEAEAKARLAAAEKTKRAQLLAKAKGGKDKAAATIAEKPADKGAAAAAEKPAAKPADKSAKLSSKVADRPVGKPAEKSVKMPMKITDLPEEKPAKPSAKQPSKLAGRATEKPAEKSAKLPPKIADRPTDKPASKSDIKVASAKR